jgi:hypothetical protein
MLSGLRAARRAPSTLSKSSRWSLGCIHPLSSRSGFGAVSAWPPVGGHQGRRAKMRRPCAWLAPSSWARQPVYTGSGKRGRSCEDRPACQVCRDHQTRLVPSLSLGPESPLEFEPTLQSANADFRKRQGPIGCRRLGLPPKQAARDVRPAEELIVGNCLGSEVGSDRFIQPALDVLAQSRVSWCHRPAPRRGGHRQPLFMNGLTAFSVDVLPLPSAVGRHDPDVGGEAVPVWID